VAEQEAIAGNITRNIVAERPMAIKQPPINTEGQPEGLRHPTVRPAPARIFLSRATEHKAAHVMPVRAGNREAQAIVPVAGQTAAVAGEIAAVAGEIA
jgi:hypothetical protein